MPSYALSTPVALFVWNRPDTTRRVFAGVAEARPRRLLIVADAARRDVPEDTDRCREVREIVSRIDWPCSVERAWADVHLGCRERMVSGLRWVFDVAEQAIVLEDDCVPAPAFFPFCQELLERHRCDPRVMMIAGSNFLPGEYTGPHSYYFSRFNPTWGWASWRRAFRHFDPHLKLWQSWPRDRKRRFLRSISPTSPFEKHWGCTLDRVPDGDCWDHQWNFAIWSQGGLSAIPAANLISNVGFGPDATHTCVDLGLGHRPLGELTGPLRHPSEVAPDFAQERAIWQLILF